MRPTFTFSRERAGGVALTTGFLLAALVLYRNPASGLDAATATAGSMVYFLLLPVAGLLAGLHVAISGRYAAPLLFSFGTYLGVFGLAVTLGSLLATGSSGVLAVLGATLVVLGVVALVAGVHRVTVPLGVAVDAAWAR